jgi:hypothetical protein
MRLVYFTIITFLAFNQCSTQKKIEIDNSKSYNGLRYSSDCVVEFDDYDKLTRTRIIGMKSERLFTYTHERLQDVFVDKPFMIADASLSRSNNNQYFLMLSFTVDNKYVKTGYNGLSASNKLRLTLINGELVFLDNILNESGKIDKSSEYITYKGIFTVSKANSKLLRKFELDKIGVMWNGGFEEYSIYNLELLKKQFNCLQKLSF